MKNFPKVKGLDGYISVGLLVCNSEPMDKYAKCNHSNEGTFQAYILIMVTVQAC